MRVSEAAVAAVLFLSTYFSVKCVETRPTIEAKGGAASCQSAELEERRTYLIDVLYMDQDVLSYLMTQ